MISFRNWFCLSVIALALTSTSLDSFAQQNSQPGIEIVRLDHRFDKLVPLNAKIEKVASGHKWVEGPVWNRKERYLLFSDIPNN